VIAISKFTLGSKDEEEYLKKYQKPRSHQVFGLTAKPWHSAEELGFARLLEDRHEQILEELLALISLQNYGGMFPVDGTYIPSFHALIHPSFLLIIGQKLSEYNLWKVPTSSPM